MIVRHCLLFLCAFMLLSACGLDPTIPPTSTPGLTLLSTIVNTRENQAFSIWLYEGEVPPSEIDPLDPPALESEPLITLNKIEYYDPQTHEIRLTGEGYETIHNLMIPTNGLAFSVCVDGETIYTGAFWVAYSSLSYDGVVIDPLLATSEEPVIHITLGYPGDSFFEGEDLRSDARISKTLEEAGKLKTD